MDCRYYYIGYCQWSPNKESYQNKSCFYGNRNNRHRKNLEKREKWDKCPLEK